MDSYEEIISWMFQQLPVYQNSGSKNYKIDLKKTWSFMNYLESPQETFPCFHIGGTNGKGSTSHMISSILMTEGYKVGLYTSPHLLDFRERIKINGKLIPKKFVIDFIKKNKFKIDELKLSFFELTVGMAFDAFRKAKVDLAVIEVGMGGRLDSTNVINPLVSVITNVELDHTEFLGETRRDIAREKAGIIKPNTPVVIEQKDQETQDVFIQVAKKQNSKVVWVNKSSRVFEMDLKGSYQNQNQRTAIAAISAQNRFPFSTSGIKKGLINTSKSTGFRGRWQIINHEPFIVIDTAHNPSGLKEVMSDWRKIILKKSNSFMILGSVLGKDWDMIWKYIPAESKVFITEPKVQRALPASQLYYSSRKHRTESILCNSLLDAVMRVKKELSENDALFIGGTTFLVADFLRIMDQNKLF